MGRGYVDLCEQLPLEGCEWEAQTNAFEYRLVEEKERLSPIGSVVHTKWLPRGAMTNRDMRIVGFAEGVKVVQPQVTQVILYVFNGGQFGAFVQ